MKLKNPGAYFASSAAFVFFAFFMAANFWALKLYWLLFFPVAFLLTAYMFFRKGQLLKSGVGFKEADRGLPWDLFLLFVGLAFVFGGIQLLQSGKEGAAGAIIPGSLCALGGLGFFLVRMRRKMRGEPGSEGEAKEWKKEEEKASWKLTVALVLAVPVLLFLAALLAFATKNIAGGIILSVPLVVALGILKVVSIARKKKIDKKF